MGWTLTKEGYDRARHEGGHLTAAILLGIPVLSARIDEPEPGLAGVVLTQHVATPLGLEKQLAAVLAGSLAEGRPLDWPFDQHDQGDRLAAFILIWVLDLGGADFLRVESLARQLLDTDAGRHLQYEFSGALLERGRLTRNEIYELVESS